MQSTRALTELDARLYTWPVGAWAFALLFLYLLSDIKLAIGLCYPIAAWWGAVSILWARRTAKQVELGELTLEDASGGVRWIGHTLAGISAAPAIIFMAAAPFEPSSWATVGSVGVWCGLTYGLVNLLSQRTWRLARATALLVACLALPINATGAISLAWWWGLVDGLNPF